MAELTDDEREAKRDEMLIEEKKRLDSILESYDRLDKAMGGATKASKEARQNEIELSKRRKSQIDQEVKDTRSQSDKAKAYIKQLDDLTKKVKAGTISVDEFNEETSDTTWKLNALQKGLDAATRQASKDAINNAKNYKLGQDALQEFAKGLFTASAALIKSVASAGAGILTKIQSGANGIGVASEIMTKGVELAGQGAQAASGMVTTAGAAMTLSSNKYVKSIGVVTQVLGSLGGAAAAAYTEFQKFKIQFLTTEIDNAVKNFQSLSGAGIVFGQGLETLQSSSAAAGMSMTTMAAIGTKNAALLAASGLGMSEGFKKLGKVFAQGGPQFKESLLNLGIGLEEQGEIVSQVMADMRRTGRNMASVTDGEIASSTQEYAKNLKIISGITGDDAKARMEQARDLASTSAMQSELANMDVAEREKFIADLALVPQNMKKAVMQQRLLGVVTDKHSSILMSAVPSMQKNVRAWSDGLGKGVEGIANINAQAAQDMKAANVKGGTLDVMSRAVLAGAGGTVSEFDTMVTGLNKEQLKGPGSKEDVSNQIASVEAAISDSGNLVKKINETIVIGEATRAKLENEAFKHLDDFISELKKVLTIASNIISEGPGAAKSLMSDIGNWASSLLGVTGLLSAGAGVIGRTKTPTPSTPDSPGKSFQPTAAAKKASAAATFGEAAEGAITKTAGVEVAKDVSKVAAGTVGKTAAKGIMSKLPGIGAVIGIIGAAQRVSQGDYIGAGLEAAAGLASTVPGIGTGVSIALSGALIAKDLGAFDSKPTTEGTPKSTVDSSLSNHLAETQPSPPNTDATPAAKPSEDMQKAKLDQSMLVELKKIGEFISESIKTAQLTLEAQQRLVTVSGDQLRLLDRLDKNSR